MVFEYQTVCIEPEDGLEGILGDFRITLNLEAEDEWQPVEVTPFRMVVSKSENSSENFCW